MKYRSWVIMNSLGPGYNDMVEGPYVDTPVRVVEELYYLQEINKMYERLNKLEEENRKLKRDKV